MNIKEYIASGILESYALGLTTAEESREVERMVKEHPEVKAELEQVQLALEGYAAQYEKTPPPALKQKVMDAVASEERAKPEARVVPISGNEETNTVKKGSRFAAWLAAASILLLIAVGAYAYMLQQQLEKQKQEVANLQRSHSSEISGLKNEIASLKEMENNYYATVAIIKDPQYKMVRLKGMEIAPTSMATVYWNPVAKDVHLTINNLPAPPQGMQYQLWAIVDGKPVDAGMIDMSEDGLYKMKGFASAQAFAITLEKAGGSPEPNLSALYVMGNV